MFTNILATFALVATLFAPAYAPETDAQEINIEIDIPNFPTLANFPVGTPGNCTGYVGQSINSDRLPPLSPGTDGFCPPPAGQPTWPYYNINSHPDHTNGCLPTGHQNDGLSLPPGHLGWCWPAHLADQPGTTAPEVTTTAPEVTTTAPEVTTTAPEVTTTAPDECVCPTLPEGTTPEPCPTTPEGTTPECVCPEPGTEAPATDAPSSSTPGNRLPQTGIVAANIGLAGAALAGIGAYLKKKQ